MPVGAWTTRSQLSGAPRSVRDVAHDDAVLLREFLSLSHLAVTLWRRRMPLASLVMTREEQLNQGVA